MTTLICAALMGPRIITKTVEYKDAHGTVCEGFVAVPARPLKTAPWVIVVQDWDGLNEHEMRVSKKLAEAGYCAFAADIYGKGVRPTTPAANGAEAGKYYKDPALYKHRLAAARNAAAAIKVGDHSRTAAIGYCFGGSGVLTMAREDMGVKAVVSFHGGLAPLEKVEGDYKPAILVCHGLADGTQNANVEPLKKEMAEHHAKFTFIGYPGAKHAFTVLGSDAMKNPNVGYQKEADEKSWKDMLTFFKKNL